MTRYFFRVASTRRPEPETIYPTLDQCLAVAAAVIRKGAKGVAVRSSDGGEWLPTPNPTGNGVTFDRT